MGPVVPESGLQVVLCEYACIGKMAAKMHFKVQENEQIHTAGTAVALGQSMTTEVRGGVCCISYLSKRTDTRSIATITDSLSGVAGLGSEALPGLAFSFPETETLSRLQDRSPGVLKSALSGSYRTLPDRQRSFKSR